MEDDPFAVAVRRQPSARAGCTTCGVDRGQRLEQLRRSGRFRHRLYGGIHDEADGREWSAPLAQPAA
jgi:hypothetical protein